MLEVYYKEKDGNIYNFKDFEEGRRGFSKYNEFYNHYVQEVVGQDRFNYRILNFSSDGGILATRSDEALALVLLENIEERNLDICKNMGV